MKVDDAIVIVILSDWLKYLAPVFPPMRRKLKTIPPRARAIFSRVLSKLQVIARNSDWLIALFDPVMNGGSNYFGIGFSTVISVKATL